MSFDPRDHYNRKAKNSWYKARSIYKLEEIDKKFHIFGPDVTRVMDLWCSPGSRLQYANEQINEHEWKRNNKKNQGKILIGLDIKPVEIQLQDVHTYVDDITDVDRVGQIAKSHSIKEFDVIISDAAPNTTGIKDLDASRSIQLVRDTLPIYQQWLKPWGRAVMKVFMGEGFDELVAECKQMRWGREVKVYKPDASRSQSKEVFIIKRGNH
jgi:23S rRNA (uridine2552-2'-O)-methyltransferase